MITEFLDHIRDTYNLSPDQAANLMDEFTSYFNESMEEFIRRRHSELKADGFKNDVIYKKINSEIGKRRFAAGSLTERQIRRAIYG